MSSGSDGKEEGEGEDGKERGKGYGKGWNRKLRMGRAKREGWDKGGKSVGEGRSAEEDRKGKEREREEVNEMGDEGERK